VLRGGRFAASRRERILRKPDVLLFKPGASGFAVYVLIPLPALMVAGLATSQ
jgi:hypothetical protein